MSRCSIQILFNLFRHGFFDRTFCHSTYMYIECAHYKIHKQKPEFFLLNQNEWNAVHTWIFIISFSLLLNVIHWISNSVVAVIHCYYVCCCYCSWLFVTNFDFRAKRVTEMIWVEKNITFYLHHIWLTA